MKITWIIYRLRFLPDSTWKYIDYVLVLNMVPRHKLGNTFSHGARKHLVVVFKFCLRLNFIKIYVFKDQFLEHLPSGTVCDSSFCTRLSTYLNIRLCLEIGRLQSPFWKFSLLSIFKLGSKLLCLKVKFKLNRQKRSIKKTKKFAKRKLKARTVQRSEREASLSLHLT